MHLQSHSSSITGPPVMERTLSLLRARALPHLSDNCLRASPRPAHHPPSTRTVTSSTTLNAPLPKPHQLPPRPKIKEEDITESFLKGSGPGGMFDSRFPRTRTLPNQPHPQPSPKLSPSPVTSTSTRCTRLLPLTLEPASRCTSAPATPPYLRANNFPLPYPLSPLPSALCPPDSHSAATSHITLHHPIRLHPTATPLQCPPSQPLFYLIQTPLLIVDI